MEYVIGIGSNLGDKFLNIENALKLLSKHLKILKTSSIYESKALLEVDAPKEWDKDFFNLTILVDFSNNPFQLFKVLKSIEMEMGRGQSKPRFSPRIIDLDILIAKNLTLQKEELQIPHKELLNRKFALIPASEIAPSFIHPLTKKTLKEHRIMLDIV